jgi:hypothetical protein
LGIDELAHARLPGRGDSRMTERRGEQLTPEARERRIAWGLEKARCPNCGKALGEGDEKYGSGRFRDGVFCSMRCFAEFHHDIPRKHGIRVLRGQKGRLEDDT